MQGVSDHYGVLLEVEWEGDCVPHVERRIPIYHKTDVWSTNFPSGKFAAWACYGSCVEEIWRNFKGIVHESVEPCVPHKLLLKNPDPEYYNKEGND